MTLAFRALFLSLTYRRGVTEYRFTYMGEQAFDPLAVLQELKELGLPATRTFCSLREEIIKIPFSFSLEHHWEKSISVDETDRLSMYKQIMKDCSYAIFYLSEVDTEYRQMLSLIKKKGISLVEIRSKKDISFFLEL